MSTQIKISTWQLCKTSFTRKVRNCSIYLFIYNHSTYNTQKKRPLSLSPSNARNSTKCEIILSILISFIIRTH